MSKYRFVVGTVLLEIGTVSLGTVLKVRLNQKKIGAS